MGERRLVPKKVPDDEGESEVDESSFLKDWDAQTEVRKSTKKKATLRGSRNVYSSPNSGVEVGNSIVEFAVMDSSDVTARKARRSTNNGQRNPDSQDTAVALVFNPGSGEFIGVNENGEPVDSKSGLDENALFSNFRLRQKPFQQETLAFQQDAFFDYVEVLVGNVENIEDFLNERPHEISALVEIVSWLNRQFVLNNFLQQTLSFHIDLLSLFNASKKRDLIKFNAEKTATLTEDFKSQTKRKLIDKTLGRSNTSPRTKMKFTTIKKKSRQMLEVENKTTELLKHLSVLTKFYGETQQFEFSLKVLEETENIEDKLFGCRRPQYAQLYYERAMIESETGQIEESVESFRQAIEHGQRIMGKASKAVANWYSNFGLAFRQKGDLERAKEYLTQALETDRAAGASEDNENVALDLENLAFLYTDLNDLPQAIYCIKEALRINKLCLGDIHKDVARNLTTLSKLLVRNNGAVEAEQYLRFALMINQNLYGEESYQVANASYDLAVILKHLGRPEESLGLLEHAVEIVRNRGNKAKVNSPRMAEILLELAVLEKERKNLDRSLTLLKESFSIRNNSAETDMVAIATLYFHIGDVLRLQGFLNDALTNLSKSFEIRRRVLGNKNRTLPHTMNAVANCLADMNRLPESLAMHEAVLQLDREILGEDHYDVATDLTNVAILLADLGKFDEAIEYVDECLELRKKLFGEGHPLYGSCLNNKACIVRGLGNLAEAETLLLKAIELGEQNLGVDHPDVALRKNNLAEIYQTTNRKDEAEKKYREAFDCWSKTLGGHHPRVGLVASSLALLLTDQGRYFDALTFQYQALDIDIKTYGERDMTVARDMNNLGKLLRTLGQLEEAEKFILEGLAMRKETLGEGHPHVALSLENLALLRRAQDQEVEAEKLGKEGYFILADALGENHQWTKHSKCLWFKQMLESEVHLQPTEIKASDRLETNAKRSGGEYDATTLGHGSLTGTAPLF